MFGYCLAWLCQFIDNIWPGRRVELIRYQSVPRSNSFYTGRLRLLIGLEGTLVCTSPTPKPGWDKINIKYSSGATQDFYVKHRPYLDQFLNSVSKIYDHLYNLNIRLCSSNNKQVLHSDQAQFLQIKSCVILSGNNFQKEINMTTTNPHNVIFIDCDEKQCQANSENAQQITQYRDQENDTELLKLKDFLTYADAQMKVKKEIDLGISIQDVLQEMKAQIDK